ncbi:MAG: M20/M25/M40 family metallo-hydrolase, partial [Longimicrobiales bacterium]
MAATTLTIAFAFAPPSAAAQTVADPRVQALLDSVSEERLDAILRKLESFGTRHLMTVDMEGGKGIGAARQWILEQFRSYSPRLEASLDCYQVLPQGRIPGEVELCNVMAILPGRTERRVYVSGHYDTVARQEDGSFDWSEYENPAPGVNDDGSGTALTMELARVFGQSGIAFDATIVFLAVAGEEEGLVGANLHASRMAEDSVDIDAVFNNDIIGNSWG